MNLFKALIVTVFFFCKFEANFALDGYDLLCPRNDLTQISADVRRCEQVSKTGFYSNYIIV